MKRYVNPDLKGMQSVPGVIWPVLPAGVSRARKSYQRYLNQRASVAADKAARDPRLAFVTSKEKP